MDQKVHSFSLVNWAHSLRIKFERLWSMYSQCTIRLKSTISKSLKKNAILNSLESKLILVNTQDVWSQFMNRWASYWNHIIKWWVIMMILIHRLNCKKFLTELKTLKCEIAWRIIDEWFLRRYKATLLILSQQLKTCSTH